MFRISPALHPDTPALHNPAMSRASVALHPKKFVLISAFFVEICGVCIFCRIFGVLWNDSFFLIEFCWLVIYDFEIGAAKTSKMNHGSKRCEN